VQRSAKFAKYLPRYGYQPHVVTCRLTDITGSRDEEMLEEVRDCRIHRTVSWERAVARIRGLSLVLRPDTRILWKRGALRLGARIGADERVDVIYTSVDPFSSAMAGMALKRRLGVPWVIDFRDPWTQNTRLKWLSRLHYWHDRFLEKAVLRAADAVVVVTPGMANVLRDAHPFVSPKVHVVYNGYDEDDMHEPCRGAGIVQDTEDPCQLRIGFAGTLWPWKTPIRERAKELLGFRVVSCDLSTQSPLYLFRAARKLLDECPSFAKILRIRIAGARVPENEKLAAELGLDEIVEFRGYLPHRESIRLLCQSDVLFLPMRAECEGRRSYNASGKVFEYLAAGKPILAAVPEGDAADLVLGAGAGWVVNPYDVEGLKQRLRWLIEKKRIGALSVATDRQYVEQFERKVLTARLAHLFDELLEKRAPS